MKSKDWFSRRSHHWVAKIVCFLVAVIFWLYVMGVAPPEYTETYVDVPVTVVGAEDFEFTGTASNLPSVRVKATKTVLAEYGREDVKAWVNLMDLETRNELLLDGRTVKLTVRFDCPSVLRIEDSYEVDVTLQKKIP